MSKQLPEDSLDRKLAQSAQFADLGFTNKVSEELIESGRKQSLLFTVSVASSIMLLGIFLAPASLISADYMLVEIGNEFSALLQLLLDFDSGLLAQLQESYAAVTVGTFAIAAMVINRILET